MTSTSPPLLPISLPCPSVTLSLPLPLIPLCLSSLPSLPYLSSSSTFHTSPNYVRLFPTLLLFFPSLLFSIFLYPFFSPSLVSPSNSPSPLLHVILRNSFFFFFFSFSLISFFPLVSVSFRSIFMCISVSSFSSFVVFSPYSY